jgi:hypothetical protein
MVPPPPKRRRLITESSDYINLIQEGQRLLSLISNCYTAEPEVTSPQQEAAKAYQLLSASPEIRNVLMGADPKHYPSASLSIVLKFNTGILSMQPMSITNDGSSFVRRTEAINRHQRVQFLRELLDDEEFISLTLSQFPRIRSYGFGEQFVTNLLGNDVCDGTQSLSFQEIIRRLNYVEEHLVRTGKRLSQSHGSLWCNDVTPSAIRSQLLTIQKEFIVLLTTMAESCSLDDLAPSYLPPSLKLPG